MKFPRMLPAIAAAILLAGSLCHADDTVNKTFPRGALRSPAHHLLTAPTHQVGDVPPAEFARVPVKLDMWGNDRYGDCVTAEEAYAKGCFGVFIDPAEVVKWAREHRYLHGADLASVMQSMQQAGFRAGSQQYNDGSYSTVNYSDETILRSAIFTGPVKLAIDASALPSGAGNQQGWYTIASGQYPNTDHCVSTSGYGSAKYLFSQLNVPLPQALAPDTEGYLCFTWSTIGFVTHDWLMSTCTEAWVRNPTTVGVPPIPPSPAPPAPSPVPGPTPAPVPTPPAPVPGASLSFGEALQIAFATGTMELTDVQATALIKFLAVENSPRVRILKQIIYSRGLHTGAIPAGTEVAAVNWQQLIAIMVELEPLIVPLIPLLFGDGDEQALLPLIDARLCSADAAHRVPVEKTEAKKPVAKPAKPAYRKECTKKGCRMVPVEKSPLQKLFNGR